MAARSSSEAHEEQNHVGSVRRMDIQIEPGGDAVRVVVVWGGVLPRCAGVADPQQSSWLSESLASSFLIAVCAAYAVTSPWYSCSLSLSLPDRTNERQQRWVATCITLYRSAVINRAFQMENEMPARLLCSAGC